MRYPNTLLAVLGAISLGADASAIEFISVPAGTVGNEPGGMWGPPYSWDLYFDVVSPISVSSLGAFDSGSDADFVSTITVVLFDRTTGTAVSPQLTFTTADSGNLVGGFRYKDLSAPIHLPAGFLGALVVAGHGPAGSAYEPFGNRVHPGGPATAFDDGGGLIGNLGAVTYSQPTTVPVFPGSHSFFLPDPVVAAGSFQYSAYTPGTNVPDSSSAWVLLVVSLAGLGALRRRG